ncbi:dnaJ homolog subfamily C member 4-like isoform X2 [Colletes gigas]|uniref:dnaJ homolog subfamily C member 4-like isoform X2 n=1 Tax=Colletes gigas TaxID=935657 RepID=UPI001C9ACA2A|nr:dnaJ homolog subfamily C member 4-like isoform X2 [Colletes gigas]
MAHIFRAYKFKIPVIIRNYGNYSSSRRPKYSHYEILRVSPNATQKEIKDAYIKLSKEMHPDAGNKGSHDDFVKVNEAYTTLSKKDKRQEYDKSLHYNDIVYDENPFRRNNYQNYSYQNRTYEFRRANVQWERRKATSRRQSEEQSKRMMRKVFTIIVFIMFIEGFLSFVISKHDSPYNRRSVTERDIKDELEYIKLKEETKDKTLTEQMDHLRELQEKYNLDPYAK